MDPGWDEVLSQYPVPDPATLDREALAASTVGRGAAEGVRPRDDRCRISQDVVCRWAPDGQRDDLPRCTSGVGTQVPAADPSATQGRHEIVRLRPRGRGAHPRGARELRPSNAVLFDGEALQPRVVAVDVVDEPHAGHMGFDDVELLEWGDDEQLQPELRKEPKGVAGRIIRAPTERFIDYDEAESVAAGFAGRELELISERRCEDRVGEFLLLAARLAGGVAVALVLLLGIAPPLACREHEPLSDVGDPAFPRPVLIAEAFSALEAVDDRLYLEEALF